MVDNSKKLLDVRVETNKILSDWLIDMKFAMEFKSPEKIGDRFIEVENDNIDAIKPLFPILKFCYKHGALWTVIDIKNEYSGDYPYYVIIQKFQQQPEKLEFWKEFLKYPAKNPSHFEQKLLDMSRIVLGESKHPILPVLIYRDANTDKKLEEEFPLIKSLNVKTFYNCVQNYSQKLSCPNNTKEIDVKNLIEKFEDLCKNGDTKMKEVVEMIWKEADNAWGIKKRCEEKKWNEPQQRFANYLFWLNMQNDQWQYYFYIPAVVHSEDTYRTTGGIAIAFETKPDKELFVALCEITNRVLGEWTRVYLEVFRYLSALRSAVAAIMARNFSHLWGSNLFEIIKKERNIDDTKKILDYIAERSEFIANTTGEIPLSWGYDYLVYSHKNNLIGLVYGDGFNKAIEYLEKLKPNCTINPQIDIDNELKDKAIALPYGKDVGKHALYSMLEGYIRNIQKHGKIENSIVICIKKVCEGEGYFKVRLSSNSKIAESSGDYCRKADQIEKLVNSSMINDDGSMNYEAWGFKEMRICAFALAGIPFEFLDDKEIRDKVFRFVKEDAEERGEYNLEFILRKVKNIEIFEEKEKIDNLIKAKGEKEILPLINFAIFSQNLLEEYFSYWEIFPLRVGVLKNSSDNPFLQNSEDKFFKEWLMRRMVEADESTSNSYQKLMKKWLDKLNIKKAKIKVVDKNIGLEKSFSSTETNMFDYVIHHDDENSKNCSKTFCKNNNCKMIEFSKRGSMLEMIKKTVNNEDGIHEEWSLILGSKVLLIDDRLFKIWNESEKKDDFEKIGLIIFPEEGTEIKTDNNEIYVSSQEKNSKVSLNGFHFLSIHLTYLVNKYHTQKDKFPLFYKENLKKLPIFIFVHTGRGKIEEEISKNFPWLRKMVSYQNLRGAISTNYPLQSKIDILRSFYY